MFPPHQPFADGSGEEELPKVSSGPTEPTITPLSDPMRSPYDPTNYTFGHFSGSQLVPPPPPLSSNRVRVFTLSGISAILLFCVGLGFILANRPPPSTSFGANRGTPTNQPIGMETSTYPAISTYPPTSTTVPGGPTPTPWATYTPVPTYTPIPSGGTALPTATATHVNPTATTARPTATPTPSIATVDDSDQAQFKYKGSWVHQSGLSSQQFLNGTVSSSNITGDVVVVNFTGTRIQAFGPAQPNGGFARINIDATGGDVVDQYHSPAIYYQELFDSGTLPAGAHKFSFKCMGTKDGASSDITVLIDYVVITP